MKDYIYVAEHESRNCCESFAYSFDFEEIKCNALSFYQHLSKYDKNDTDVWVYKYKLYKDDIINEDDAEETYFNMVEMDMDDLGYLRDSEDAYKLNRVDYKLYNSNVIITDDFGNMCDYSLCRDSFFGDDYYEQVDDLYDTLKEHLLIDKETVRDSRELILIEGIIEERYETYED